MKKPTMSRVGAVVALMVLHGTLGCSRSHDPCDGPLAVAAAGPSMALTISLFATANPRERSPLPLDCVVVTVLNATDYADTLRVAPARVTGGRIHLANLREARADVIIERVGFFPVKVVEVEIGSAPNELADRLTMYPSDAPIVLPGQLYVELKPGATREQLVELVEPYDDTRIHAEPGSYRIELAVRGRRETIRRTELLCRDLLFSPIVHGAGPMAGFGSVY